MGSANPNTQLPSGSADLIQPSIHALSAALRLQIDLMKAAAPAMFAPLFYSECIALALYLS